MIKLLRTAQRNLHIAVPIAIVAGLVVGSITEIPFLKTMILPITFLMVYPMMITLPIKKLTAPGGNSVQGAAVAINFGAIPLIAYGYGRLFFPNDEYLQLAMLLMGLIPTSGMTIAWTGMAKGNKLAAIKMTVIGLILGAILTPIYTSFLMGSEVELPLTKITVQIMIIVILPLVLGYATQRAIISRYGESKFQNEIKPELSLASTVGVLLMVFVAMILKATQILSDPILIVKMIPVLIVFYITIYVMVTLIGRSAFDRNDAIALVFGTAMRNLSVVLALSVSLFRENGSEMALLMSLAFVVQIQSAVLYTKMADRLFRPQPETITSRV